ncbi:MAG: precorrin-3B C(17)-methyltransferase [Nitrospirae bacterium GWF2_44_13]|nr:MAG: precorrin-3B C(17)-methyltransferase [Nitrospirae bacterium GWF2_44_13]OGW64143.1 MAG: precorrin-3B C(17)-methyltransferase [Nitrospirae bacterium RIFOXYA2_FULL_44_9]HBG92438.1 precorrin-3B C(17)-methyltransferase [Nitrospiraceae bacterium]
MAIENNTAIFYITANSFALAKKLNSLYPDAKAFKFKPDTLSKFWGKHKSFIFIMATGIVVRTIAPLIKDKTTDPAVIVLDEKEKHAISLLSGHLGGANKLAKEIAEFLGGQAVITTASDVNNMTSIDLWAKENGLIIDNCNLVPQVATRFINKGKLKVYSEVEIKMPEGFLRTDKPSSADVLITNKKDLFTHSPIHPFTQLYLRPKNLIIGIGCNRGTSANEIEDAVKKALAEKKLSFLSIHSVATIDIKAGEKGLNEFVRAYGFPIKTFTANELNSLRGIQKSALVFKATGAYAVAEPAALLASGADKLLLKKQKMGNVTVAVSEIKSRYALCVMRNKLKDKNPSLITDYGLRGIGKLYIVGTGPGSVEHITPYAQKAIRNSDVIVGYGTYIELIKELIKDKEIVSTGMTHEIDRCKKAVELAISGRTVSVISGGDPGIYAMAGLVFEVLKSHQPSAISHQLSVEVIPGVSALNACAARLGAPLMHDFASISLSDRLTPWRLIEKRLDAAAKADFVIILYNPKSKGRAEHIDRAREIILKCRKPETPVGIVKGAMRENERVIITDLKNMLEHDIDMQTTVIIGNSQTFVWDNRMITPRGYENKRQ